MSKRILVIEDQEDNRQILRDLLTSVDFEVIEAADGEAGLAAAAAHRPELFAVIANWPQKRIQHWIRLLQARAIENQACVVGVNRIGNDPYYAYGGHSLIIDPLGEILADAGTREGLIQAKLDLANLRKYREGLPFLADMRSR